LPFWLEKIPELPDQLIKALDNLALEQTTAQKPAPLKEIPTRKYHWQLPTALALIVLSIGFGAPEFAAQLNQLPALSWAGFALAALLIFQIPRR